MLSGALRYGIRVGTVLRSSLFRSFLVPAQVAPPLTGRARSSVSNGTNHAHGSAASLSVCGHSRLSTISLLLLTQTSKFRHFTSSETSILRYVSISLRFIPFVTRQRDVRTYRTGTGDRRVQRLTRDQSRHAKILTRGHAWYTRESRGIAIFALAPAPTFFSLDVS